MEWSPPALPKDTVQLFIHLRPPAVASAHRPLRHFLPQAGQQYGHISQSAWNKQHSPSSARCMMTRCLSTKVFGQYTGTIPISLRLGGYGNILKFILFHWRSLFLFKICSESDAIGVKQCELDYGTGVFSRIVIGDEQFWGYCLPFSYRCAMLDSLVMCSIATPGRE